MGNRERQKNILTITTIAVVLIFSGGIYFYYYFFRQVNAKLIETIPTDAVFLFQINDNETFLKTTKNIHSYISPLFGLDAYPGCQFFLDQLPGRYNQVIFTGHVNDGVLSILFACKINERAFKQLLSKLRIDEKNHTNFDPCQIYTYGTHLKRFVFTYHKGIFLASENMILLKKAITQLKNPKNLIVLKSFEELFGMIEKNNKQNWLILNYERYFDYLKAYFNEETNRILAHFSENVTWAAYQIRFSDLEISLAGYMAIHDNFRNYFNNLEQKYLYYSSLDSKMESIDFEKDLLIKEAKSVLPTYNDFELVIHAANPDYWSRYLSELGMKRFTIAHMNLLAFTFKVKPGNSSSVQISNGLIKF